MKAGVVVVAPSRAQSFAGTETKRGETIESTAERGRRQAEDAEGAHNEGSEAGPGRGTTAADWRRSGGRQRTDIGTSRRVAAVAIAIVVVVVVVAEVAPRQRRRLEQCQQQQWQQQQHQQQLLQHQEQQQQLQQEQQQQQQLQCEQHKSQENKLTEKSSTYSSEI